jgi:hypothetical protein
MGPEKKRCKVMTARGTNNSIEVEDELDRQSRLIAQRFVLQLEGRCVADPSGKMSFEEVLQLVHGERRPPEDDGGDFAEMLMEVLEESGFPCRRHRGKWFVRGLRFARA